MGHWLGESAWSTLEVEQVVDTFMNGALPGNPSIVNSILICEVSFSADLAMNQICSHPRAVSLEESRGSCKPTLQACLRQAAGTKPWGDLAEGSLLILQVLTVFFLEEQQGWLMCGDFHS